MASQHRSLSPCNWHHCSRHLRPTERVPRIRIFDEANQVLPEDAVPAILRGKKIVVAGDNKQLPPTTFFAAGDEEEYAADEEGGAA